jgi:hypothetical protein
MIAYVTAFLMYNSTLSFGLRNSDRVDLACPLTQRSIDLYFFTKNSKLWPDRSRTDGG